MKTVDGLASGPISDQLTWSGDTPPRATVTGQVEVPVDIADAVHCASLPGEAISWLDDVAEMLDVLPHGIALRLNQHVDSMAAGRRLAHALAQAICDALVRRGAPTRLAVEIDQEQSSEVAEGRRYRTLLPHHDGGNASFLTPSVLDDSSFGVQQRRTYVSAVTTTRRHKMYQGFLLRSPGDYASITTYYDLLAVLRAAHYHQSANPSVTPEELARWTGGNLRRALSLMQSLGGTYVTLAGLLGSASPTHVVTAVHCAEDSFSAEDVIRFPDLQPLVQGGQSDLSPVERLFDQVLHATLGKGWLECRQHFELGVPGGAYDLLLGHNLTLLHGGWRGGRGRVIEPICFVVDDPSGDEYERWLWHAWRRASSWHSPLQCPSSN